MEGFSVSGLIKDDFFKKFYVIRLLLKNKNINQETFNVTNPKVRKYYFYNNVYYLPYCELLL